MKHNLAALAILIALPAHAIVDEPKEPETKPEPPKVSTPVEQDQGDELRKLTKDCRTDPITWPWRNRLNECEPRAVTDQSYGGGKVGSR